MSFDIKFSASKKHVESLGKPRNSTSVLEALLGKLNFKRHSPSILYLFQRIVTERDSLKEVNEELKCTQLQTAETNNEDISTSPGLEMLSMPPAIK